MDPVETYAREVVAGTVPAGKYHRLACQRHLSDLARQDTPGFPYVFRWEAAEHFFRFAHKLRHYKGEWAGQVFEPSPFQVFRLGAIFGWRHAETGLRRVTTAYVETPRKNGKTFEAAIVLLYCTFFEGEPGAEGICIATKLQQSKLVFRDAKKLVQSSGLTSRIQVQAWSLTRDANDQKIEPLGSDYSSTDGLNPHCIVTDEFHAMRTRDLIDVVESATGARRNPMHFQITTAGTDLVSPCGDQHTYACQILDGVLEDDPSTVSFFACIAHADETDDIWTEATWKKANPHWGVSVNPDDMRKLAAKAKHMATAEAEFKQKRLNLWGGGGVDAWLSLTGWRSGQSTWDPLELKGQRCWVGVDLSSVTDFTAVVLVFPPTATRKTWRYLPWLLTPADTLADRAHRDRAPYLVWAASGKIQTNLGNRINQDVVRGYLKEAKAFYNIQQVGIDPWNAGNLAQHLTEDGFQVIEVFQNFGRMSKPSKDFEADVLDGLVDTGGHPVMAWMASNVTVAREGVKDNIQSDKKRSRSRIDGIVAAIIARGLATVHEEAREPQLLIIGHGRR